MRALLLLRRSSSSLIVSPFSVRLHHFSSMASPATTTTIMEPISPAKTRVGWIGTGVMGQSMCAHLIKAGYSLTVFNRTQSKTQPLIDMGARYAPSPLELATHSDVVFSIVGYPSDVRSVLIGPSGALHGLRPGGVLVDMTTSDPSLAVEIASTASTKGCAAIDAPVSGGDRGARTGTLAIFSGGDEALVQHLKPLFDCMGKLNYMGAIGKGQFAKLANQITIASTMVGLVEGMVYAHKAPNPWISTGARILKRDFEAGFFVKDLGICLRECQNMGLALPGLALKQ